MLFNNYCNDYDKLNLRNLKIGSFFSSCFSFGIKEKAYTNYAGMKDVHRE